MINRLFKRLCSIVLFFAVSSMSFANTSQLTQKINANVSVTGQMTNEKFALILKENLFKTVIINRPDTEQGNQTTALALKQIAIPSKINVIYQPIISGKMTVQDIQNFADYYNQLPKPILMVCRSGSRSALLFNEASKLGLLHE